MTMRDGLPPEPQFGPAEELQRDPEPPRRNLLWRALVALIVVLSAVAWAPLP